MQAEQVLACLLASKDTSGRSGWFNYSGYVNSSIMLEASCATIVLSSVELLVPRSGPASLTYVYIGES